MKIREWINVYKIPILIVVLVGAVMVASVAKPVPVYASIPGDFGAGYQAGKEAALSTFNSGGQFDASCSTSGATYCIGYHAGYNFEWGALQAS